MASKWRNKCHIFSNIRFDFYCILITFATGIFVYCYIVQIHWSIWEWCSHQIKQSIDTHANHLTGFYVIETLTLIYHFREIFHLSFPWKRQKSSLKFSGGYSEIFSVLKWQIGLKWVIWVNPLTINVPLIQKPVNWFALQINWLVSIWEGHWSLKS